LFGTNRIDHHFFRSGAFATGSGSAQTAASPAYLLWTPTLAVGSRTERDNICPTDIHRGQGICLPSGERVRNGPYWQDHSHFTPTTNTADTSIKRGSSRSPEGIFRTPRRSFPRAVERNLLSTLPLAFQPGDGAECAHNPVSATYTTVNDAARLPQLPQIRRARSRRTAAAFDQLGVRRAGHGRIASFETDTTLRIQLAITHHSALSRKRFVARRSISGDSGWDKSRGRASVFVTLRDKSSRLRWGSLRF